MSIFDTIENNDFIGFEKELRLEISKNYENNEFLNNILNNADKYEAAGKAFAEIKSIFNDEIKEEEK
jgi:hypothetical protein